MGTGSIEMKGLLVYRFALDEKAKKEVTIQVDCDPPSARTSASFVPYVAPVSHASSEAGIAAGH
jgi:hypothetical protein